MTAATLSKAIQDKLNALTGREGIVGCMLVNPEGSSLHSSLPPEVDSARLASITSTLYSNNDVSIQRMNRGSLTQMTLLTDAGVLQFYRINKHLLVVFTDAQQKINLEQFLRLIEEECTQLGTMLGAN
jgi:predicted regulator of Ras-like GTPase activity (Roadblock/LC7/MglB family)